jgi:group I intron endonuclease
MSGIYKILNKLTGGFYIGSATYFKYRFNAHRRELNLNKHNNVHLQRAWNKYGKDAFEFWIIELCDKIKLLEREQFYIDTLKPTYNILITAGSRLGMKTSKESNEKRRLWSTGRKLSEEIKLELAKQKIGNVNGRNKERWPCEDGIYCKCFDCCTVVKLEQFFRNQKMRAPKKFEMLPINA